MAVKFQVRGTSITANYAAAWAAGVNFASNGLTATVVANAAAGVFGGSVIDMHNAGSGSRFLAYTGADNMPVGSAAFSILMRIVPLFSGNPTSGQNLVQCGTIQGSYAGGIVLGISTGGLLQILMEDEKAGLAVNTTFATPLTFVNGTPLDILVTWDGTTTAGAVKAFTAQNGAVMTSLGTTTSALVGSVRTRQGNPSIILGYDSLSTTVTYTLNEFVIFDTVVLPSTFDSRTNFVTVPQNGFEGYVSVDPGIANVRAGTGYEINGASLTGTLTIPGASIDPGVANVTQGVNYEIAGTPLVGTNINTDPGVGNVAAGVNYEINSVPLVGTRLVVTNVLKAATLMGPSLSAVLRST